MYLVGGCHLLDCNLQ